MKKRGELRAQFSLAFFLLSLKDLLPLQVLGNYLEIWRVSSWDNNIFPRLEERVAANGAIMASHLKRPHC